MSSNPDLLAPLTLQFFPFLHSQTLKIVYLGKQRGATEAIRAVLSLAWDWGNMKEDEAEVRGIDVTGEHKKGPGERKRLDSKIFHNSTKAKCQ